MYVDRQKLPATLHDKPVDDSDVSDLNEARREIAALRAALQEDEGVNRSKRAKLRNLKVLVLDNSLRESTVGQVVGHSLEDKTKILDSVESCGFKHQIVAAFSAQRRVDDSFCENVMARGGDMATRYAFTEDTDSVVNGKMMFGPDHIPIGLQKMKTYGIPNAVIEIDLADKSVDWDGDFPLAKCMDMFQYLLTWSNDNLPSFGEKRLNMVNLRDFPVAMIECPERVIAFVEALALMDPAIRPAGLLYEEPMGEYFPEEMGAWTAAMRQVMDENGWDSKFQQDEDEKVDGVLLAHVHRQWGLADAVVLDCLATGADGIWCSLSEDGAAMGHACSSVTLANLARFGNRDVVTRYRTQNLAVAARTVAETVTNRPVNDRQLVYGPRAVESVFGFGGIAGGALDPTTDKDGDGIVDDVDHFNLASFLGITDPPIRISTLASPGLVQRRLVQCFGENPLFTEDAGGKLLTRIKAELEANIELEHSSPIGLAKLWDSEYGTIPACMLETMSDSELTVQKNIELLAQAEHCFADYCQDPANLVMEYSAFYHAFLQPFFGCFSCPRTRFVLDAIDLDDNGELSWPEWRFWCLWALRSFPEQIQSLDDLHATVLRNAILPFSLAPNKK